MIAPPPPLVCFGRRIGGIFAFGILLNFPLLAAQESAVRFCTPEARLWLDESQVVPFQVTAASEKSRAFDTVVVPPEAAEVLQPAVVLNKETTGFLLLRAKRAGRAAVVVDGRRLVVQIAPNPAAEILAPRPNLISPPAGASVYGTFTAGVELNAPSPAEKLAEPRILLQGGREIVPRAQTVSTPGPRRFTPLISMPTNFLLARSACGRWPGMRVASASRASRSY